MRYLKSYKLFESVIKDKDTQSFKELFYCFKDDGFDVYICHSRTQKLDFSTPFSGEKDSLTSFEVPDYNPGKTDLISTIDVRVRRPGEKEFNIDEIKENLLFIQSYVSEELGLKIEYIYIVRNRKYIYYKSINVLPSNTMIDSITISFTNTDI